MIQICTYNKYIPNKLAKIGRFPNWIILMVKIKTSLKDVSKLDDFNTMRNTYRKTQKEMTHERHKIDIEKTCRNA